MALTHPPHPQTLCAIIQDVIADFPAKPYGKIVRSPQLRHYLLNRIILRLSWTYPWQEEMDAVVTSQTQELQEHLFRMYLESAIYWELEEIIQNNLDGVENC